MAAIASCFSHLPSLRSTLNVHIRTLLPSPNFIQSNLTPKFPSLGISYVKRKASRQVFPVVISCLLEDNLETHHEPQESTPGATIDLELPRRSLLVHFTCNACGVRSQRLINRLAYEKGTVFVQCTGCSQYHKLVDNLNLVVEYDLREEVNMSSEADQA